VSAVVKIKAEIRGKKQVFLRDNKLINTKQKCEEKRLWKVIIFPGSFIPTAPDYQCGSQAKRP
jgi:hypothetical protein